MPSSALQQRTSRSPFALALILLATALAACDAAPAGNELDSAVIGDLGDEEPDFGIVVRDADEDAADVAVDQAADADLSGDPDVDLADGADLSDAGDGGDDADAELDGGDADAELDGPDAFDAADAELDGADASDATDASDASDAGTDPDATDATDAGTDPDARDATDADLDIRDLFDATDAGTDPDALLDPDAHLDLDALLDLGADVDDSGPGFDLFGSDLFDGPPYIAVRPNFIAFGEVGIDETALADLLVENDSRRTLTLISVQIRSLPSSGFALFSPVTFPYEMAPGELMRFKVRFRPTVASGGITPYGNAVRVVSEDPEDPVLDIPVQGSALTSITRCLDFDRSEVTFGLASEEAPVRRSVQLTNCGDSDVEVSALELAGEDGFRVTTAEALPVTLAPEESLPIALQYAPSTTEPRRAYLAARADTTEAITALLGGVDCPEAVIRIGDLPTTASSATLPVGEAVTLSGADSIDDAGGPLAYSWSVLDPSLAPVDLSPDATSETVTFTPSEVGNYLATLSVRSEASGRDGCFSDGATIRVAPEVGPSYRFELSWDNGDDLDIHLLRSNAEGTFTSDYLSIDDCHWGNTNPDWGASGNGGDDPTFGGDVQIGPGTETIELPSAEAGRRYIVALEYFTSSSILFPNATLEVFVDDSLAGSYEVTPIDTRTFYELVRLEADGELTDLTD